MPSASSSPALSTASPPNSASASPAALEFLWSGHSVTGLPFGRPRRASRALHARCAGYSAPAYARLPCRLAAGASGHGVTGPQQTPGAHAGVLGSESVWREITHTALLSGIY